MDDQIDNSAQEQTNAQNILPENNPQQSTGPQPNLNSTPNVQIRKKMSVTKKIIIGVGVFIGFLLIVVIGLFLTTGKERSLASQFITDVSSNKISNAYSQFSSDLKQTQDQSTFESQVATLSLDSSCALQISGIESSSSTDSGTIKTVTGKIVCDSKEISLAKFAYNGDSELVGYSIKP